MVLVASAGARLCCGGVGTPLSRPSAWDAPRGFSRGTGESGLLGALYNGPAGLWGARRRHESYALGKVRPLQRPGRNRLGGGDGLARLLSMGQRRLGGALDRPDLAPPGGGAGSRRDPALVVPQSPANQGGRRSQGRSTRSGRSGLLSIRAPASIAANPLHRIRCDVGISSLVDRGVSTTTYRR